MGGIVVMGRRTMESLPAHRPLAGRENVVLSGTMERAEGFHIVHDLAELWALLGTMTHSMPRPIFAVGGAECYRTLLPYTRRAYITRLSGTYGADVFLPPLEGFALTNSRGGETCIFEIYERV